MQTDIDRRRVKIAEKLENVFAKRQAIVLADVIQDAYEDLVKTSDFNELKEIVREIGVKVGELAEAQKGSEKRLTKLEETVGELAEAQKKTEIEIQKLTKGLRETRGEIGGLSKSMSYAFENEAYRMLPSLLKNKYKIEVKEKFIRKDIAGKEINIFALAKRDGKPIIIVGEAKLRLDEKRGEGNEDVFKDLADKVMAVKKEYQGKEVVKILITHFATKGFLSKAKEKGAIVIQSWEWQ